MKTLKSIVLLTTLTLFNLSCSKDEPTPDVTPDNQGNGEIVTSTGTIAEDDFETYQGDLGVIIDARPIARKGYKPTQVTINVSANNGDYTQTIPLDEFSLLGQIKLPIENLNDAAKEELISGVQITPEYKDANGNVIHTQTPTTVSFQSNPPLTTANVNGLSETEENTTLNFREGTSYYIQRMNSDGSPSSDSFSTTSDPTLGAVMTSTPATFNGNEPARSFTFIAIPSELNTFAIRNTESGKFLKYARILATGPNFEGSHFGLQKTRQTSFEEIQGFPDYNKFKFKLEKQNDGTYIIKNRWDNRSLKQSPGFGLTFDDSVTNIAGGNTKNVVSLDRTWRMVSTSIEWNVANIGTSFLEPILPKAETSLKYNSILTNCGSGGLSQSVGVDLTETRSKTVGWEETLSMSTSNTIGVTAGVSVNFSAKLFGVGTDVTANVETSYQHSWSATETNSNWESKQATAQQTLLVERTVTVPSGSASLVYDVVQFYPETKVNFVQRMRVKGTDNDAPLTGEQIRSLFYISGFNGVVTAIETDAIVITLKGTMTLDKVIDSESSVQDTPANCN